MSCSVRVHVGLTADPDHVFDVLQDFESYPRLTPAVREVHILDRTPEVITSRWAVNFRGGVLQWVERDLIDPVARTIAFDQLEGDFHRFSGVWTVSAQGDRTVVEFSSEFDLGMATLAQILNPVAMRALQENISLLLRGLFGDHLEPQGHVEDLQAV